MQNSKKFNFPVIEKVIIKNFSLYKKKDFVEINFDKDVFCLAGANGLGKSTFLTIINYGLTGIVIDPSKNFKSIVSTSKFYNLNKKFAENYFSGRISEDDRERASVYLKFKIGEEIFEIERSFFDFEELIKYSNGSEQNKTLSDSQRNEVYQTNIIKQTGLTSFDQFFFIQHFILTFDEYHHLLFWDKSLMETALYLFIGLNPDEAQNANNLRKKINQLGSNIRNWSDQRNRTTKTVKSLENQFTDTKEKISDETLNKYETLDDEIEELKNKIYINERELKQSELNLADYSLERTELERKYESAFSSFIKPSTNELCDDDRLKLLFTNLQEKICLEDEYVIEIDRIVNYIKSNHCNSETPKPEITDSLQKLDKNIQKIKDNISTLLTQKERLIESDNFLKKELNFKNKEIFKIEEEFGDVIKQLRSETKKDLTGVLSSYAEQIEKLNEDINDKKIEREERKAQLTELEKQLYKSFKDAQEEFIPKFKSYVENFLGFEVRVHLRNRSDGTVLVLEINDTERLSTYQLSESQRYFVDIGLRMAMIEYACNSAMFLIDTPEGSLDIAYESKAGEMFADFSTSQKLLMTANINSSELLLVLAKKCKNDRMSLERMTEWTILSDVQQDEEVKIDKAYELIEKNLYADAN